VHQVLSCYGKSCRYFGSDQGLLIKDGLVLSDRSITKRWTKRTKLSTIWI